MPNIGAISTPARAHRRSRPAVRNQEVASKLPQRHIPAAASHL